MASVRSDERPPLLRHEQRFGDYLIVRLLGRGGMGEVYEADDESGRRVALKVVNLATSSPVALLRFLREGQLAASLSHPNTVYVFGSGEADGIPFIVSELVTGGTLADRLRESGPLPVAVAVDAMLDVIAGLAAAADVGVLHRDVKPSNCFVVRDGGVKIGDFGVSVPRNAHELTELTLTGVVVGTPSYCAPEQLRGDALDVRSDIYSVGATLYCLLTGHPPFRGDSVIQLIEQVLGTPPPPLHKQRREIPTRLSETVSSCLAKHREQRPSSYDELAAALEPFSSASPMAAPPAARALAALLDALALVAIWNASRLTSSPVADPLATGAARCVETAAYFALPEYWWGASFGKSLCGLRVAALDGSRARLASLLLRGIIVALAVQATPLLAAVGLHPRGLSGFPIMTVVSVCVLFLTARRSNGYAGLHELLSGSRTWEGLPPQSRRLLVSADRTPTGTAAEVVGPYRIVHRYAPFLALARDSRLKRLVWVRLGAPNEPPLSPSRIALDRPARFRWLGGRRTAVEHWDAFGYVEGRSFSSFSDPALSFRTIAGWLLTIARECRAASIDGTLPALSLDRLWVTKTGDLMIADWPLPDARESRSDSPLTISSCQAFLREIAHHAIPGRTGSNPVPVYGRRLLDAIVVGRFTDFDELVTAVEDAASRDSTVSARRRLPAMAAASIVAMVPLMLVASLLPEAYTSNVSAYLSKQLIDCLSALDDADPRTGQAPTPSTREAAELCAAAVSREPEFSYRMNPQQRAFVDSARAKYPTATLADLDAAKAARPLDFGIWYFRRALAAKTTVFSEAPVMFEAVSRIVQLLGMIGLVSIGCAALFREGPLYRALGIAIVRPDGGDASRVRATVRAMLTWLPALAAGAVVQAFLPTGSTKTWPFVVILSLMVGMVAAAIHAARHPTRGLVDRIMGTYLVRR